MLVSVLLNDALGRCEPLIYLFRLSLKKGVFPDDLKIAKITPIYRAGDSSDISISNYRSIPALP